MIGTFLMWAVSSRYTGVGLDSIEGATLTNDNLNEIVIPKQSPESSGKPEMEASEFVPEEIDWISSKTDEILKKLGILPRELVFLAVGALSSVAVLPLVPACKADSFVALHTAHSRPPTSNEAFDLSRDNLGYYYYTMGCISYLLKGPGSCEQPYVGLKDLTRKATS